MELNIEKTLLLIVDVQNDFCSGGALEVNGADTIIPVINDLIRVFSKKGVRIAATQDWHGEGHISFASSHENKKPGDIIDTPLVKNQVLWPDHCVRGTNGADFRSTLESNSVTMVIRKGFRNDLDSYSAFFENDRDTPTGLEKNIRDLGIETVIICGIATDYCVFYSAIDCKKLGFTTLIADDAVRGVGFPEGSIETAVSKMKEAGIQFFSSKNIIDMLK
ncbi:MAG: bifunctional nicotinamidase/pyrazinamidase [Treponema sp.]|nr:bifunctional nicotinamidase/pyrazinamidase [Treponema sp.]